MNVFFAAALLLLLMTAAFVIVGHFVSRRAKARYDAEKEVASQPSPSFVDDILNEGGGSISLTLDPDNPPKSMTYAPRSDNKSYLCTCHGRVIQPGDRVVMWPVSPENGGPQKGFHLLCSEAMETLRVDE